MSAIFKTQGGGEGFFASILVKGFGASDTVSATNGSKTKTGVWNAAEARHEITKIADLGMWTVTATNGEKIITQDVLVDAAAEFSIEMAYRTYLYNAGDECVDVTGGWVFAITYGTVQPVTNPGTQSNQWVYDSASQASGNENTKQKNADNIYMAVTIAETTISLATVCAASAVDMTPYTKLKVVAEPGSDFVFGGRTRYKWPGAALTGWGGDDSDIVFQSQGTWDDDTCTLDISGVSGAVNLALLIGGYGGVYTTGFARIHQIWLE